MADTPAATTTTYPLHLAPRNPLFHFMFCSHSQQPMEVYVDDETKLTLHGLQQHYVKLQDREKNRKLFDLLDVLEFNQVRTSIGLFLVGFTSFVCSG